MTTFLYFCATKLIVEHLCKLRFVAKPEISLLVGIKDFSFGCSLTSGYQQICFKNQYPLGLSHTRPSVYNASGIEPLADVPD